MGIAVDYWRQLENEYRELERRMKELEKRMKTVNIAGISDLTIRVDPKGEKFFCKCPEDPGLPVNLLKLGAKITCKGCNYVYDI